MATENTPVKRGMNDNLPPAIQTALAPFASPQERTPEEEAKWLSADVAEALERQRPDWFDRHCERIFLQDFKHQEAMDRFYFPELLK